MSNIDKSIKLLENGKIISFATDTVYALACDAYNCQAIEKIYQIKNRDRSKFLGILATDISTIEKICYLNTQEQQFLKKFYKKGLTLILNKKVKFPKYVGDKETIAIRLANTKFSFDLARKFNGIIAMTSLNIAGNKEIISFNEALQNFSDKIDLIIDDGICKWQKPSTIVKFVKGNIKVLREGCFTI